MRVFQNFRGRRRVFLGFFEGFLLALEKLSSKTQKNSSFRRFLKKSLWNHFKTSETFTNRSGLKNQYQRWVSCTLFGGRMTISLKNIEISTRFSIFQGADFRNFRNLDFWTFDHCILYSFLRGFSLWQRGIDSTKQMTVYD